MLWIFEILVSLWFGFETITFFGRKNFDIIQRFFAGIPIGLLTFSWITLIITSHSPLNANKFYIPFISLSISSFFLNFVNKKQKLNTSIHYTFIQFWTLVLGCFFYYLLMDASMLLNYVQVKGAAFGDLPFHLSIISSFACGCNNKRNGLYDILTPFFANEKLAYPFIPDFLSGVLMATGKATIRAALFYPSALMCLSFFVGMYSLSFRFSLSHAASFLSCIIFPNLGGLGWINYICYPDIGYGNWIHYWGKNQYEYWFHALFHIITPQRSALFAFPLCYWTLYSLIVGVKKKDIRLFILAGIFTGFTPLVQVHGYVTMAQWSIVFCLVTSFSLKKRKKSWIKFIKLWAAFAIVANVMAFPQLTPFIKRISTSSKFMQINPIWKTRDKEKYGNFFGPIILWWRGLGIFGAIAIIFGFAAMKKQQIKMYIPSMVVFLIANIIRYQPWELDNTKVFYDGWIPLALPVVSQYLLILYKNKKLRILFYLFLFASCFSAMLHSYDCLVSTVTIFSKSDISFGYWIAENTPPNSIFVTSQWHAHPVESVGGRQLYIGFSGWITTHGINNDRNKKYQSMLDNPNNLDAFIENGISYVVSKDKEFFQNVNISSLKLIYNVSEYYVYKVY